jgi:exodeoxyribonuclease V alpha subunit
VWKLAFDDTTQQEEFTGRFIRMLFKNDDGSHCVALYAPKGARKEFVTVVGSTLPESAADVTFRGSWKTHERYGKQFVAEMVVNLLPKASKEVIKFIASLKTGIGEQKAKKMVDLVGIDRFWDEFSTDPMQFMSIEGISQKSLLRMIDEVKKLTVQQSLFRFFGTDLSLTAKQYQKICKFFADASDVMVDQIQENPYLLMHCDYTFAELDRFCHARRVVYATKDRMLAAAQQILMDAKGHCHVGLPKNELISNMAKLLRQFTAISTAEIETGLSDILASEELIFKAGLFYLPRAYNEESLIASVVARMARKKQFIPEDKFVKAMEKYGKDKGFTLSGDQQKAVWTALTRSMCIITGGPGTGKSTILDAILYCWKEFVDDNWLLLAPTGKAAVRMTETTGQGATTIHSALRLNVANECLDERIPPVETITQSLVVADECSMLDQSVMASLASALRGKGVQHLVLVGDPNQLPSVGWGNILADLIQSGVVPVQRLNTIYRQGAESPIITNSKKMMEDDADLVWEPMFRRFHVGNDEQNMEAACNLYLKFIQNYGIENVVLLSPYSKKTDICTKVMNKRLQQAINPDRGQPQIEVKSWLNNKPFPTFFRRGDRVMQLKNTDTLSNGDVGTIVFVAPNAPETEACVVVEFENGVTQKYLRDDLNQLDHAYALSIHKSQGSQWKLVLVILPNQPASFLKRNVLYTAITRSSKYVGIFGPTATVSYMIHNAEENERYTNLDAQVKEIDQFEAA